MADKALAGESQLIERAKNGDREAFGVLYDHYIRTIYDFIYYKTYKKEVSEDLTSQTFLKALRSIHTVSSHKPIVSWLYRIAQNTVIDYWRAKRVHSDIDDIWDLADPKEFVDELEDARSIESIKKHMGKLTSVERDVIIMRVWQEKSYREIAEVIGKTEANSKVIYGRGIKKLRDAIPFALYILLVARF